MLSEDDINSSLTSFCQLEYWQRIWTLQGIILPSKGWLVRGNCKIEASIVFHIFSSMKWHVGDCCIDFARTHSSLYEAGNDFMRAAACRVFWRNAVRSADAAVKAGQAMEDSDTSHDDSNSTTSDRDIGQTTPKCPTKDHLQLDRLHTWFGARKATNPRDHDYGLLGLLDTSYGGFIVPDYTSSIADVFAEATMACIRTREDLNVLELVSGTPKVTEGLPSWAMDWVSAEKQQVTIQQLPNHLRNIQEKLYSASKSHTARCSLSVDQKSIVVEGIHLVCIVTRHKSRNSISKSAILFASPRNVIQIARLTNTDRGTCL